MSQKNLQILLCLSFCCIFSTLIYLIPSDYSWTQNIKKEGTQIDDLSIQEIVSSIAQELPVTHNLRNLKWNCKDLNETQSQCKGSSFKKSELKALSSFFKSKNFSQFGWFSNEELLGFIEVKKGRSQEIELELSELADQIELVKKRLQPEQNTHFSTAQKTQNELIQSIANAKQQLSLIEEAIPLEKDTAVLERFEKKVAELKKTIEKQQSMLSENSSQADVNLSSDPEARELLLRKAKLLEESKHFNQLISDAEYDLQDNTLVKFKDPENIRLQTDSNLVTQTNRTFKNTPWAFSLGFVLFGLTRIRKRGVKSDKIPEHGSTPLLSAEEIEEMTGIKHLGTIK